MGCSLCCKHSERFCVVNICPMGHFFLKCKHKIVLHPPTHMYTHVHTQTHTHTHTHTHVHTRTHTRTHTCTTHTRIRTHTHTHTHTCTHMCTHTCSSSPAQHMVCLSLSSVTLVPISVYMIPMERNLLRSSFPPSLK